MLPEMNGLEVLRGLKANEATKPIPVIMLTNFGDQENVNKALEGGAEDFLLKYNIVLSVLNKYTLFFSTIQYPRL